MIDLKIGSAIRKKYVITGKHGKGTLGTEVFLGRDEENGADVIIRVLPPSRARDAEAAKRFKQSAELAKTLRHPNILPVLDAGEDGGLLFLVTPNEKGFFLDDYLEHRGRLDEKEAAKLVRALADALDYAWNEKKVIHRNISPDTVYVARENVPMLTDFELAKSLEADSHLTMTGFTVGNPYYMSPEQARGQNVDFRSDIYCLGLVFYQLLAGESPFAGKSKPEALKAQITEKHPPVKDKNSGVSEKCSEILDKMLEKDAGRRYQFWKDVLDDLDSLFGGSAAAGAATGEYRMRAVQIPGEKDAPAETAEKKPPPAKKKRWLAGVAVAVALLVVAFVAFLSGKGKGKMDGSAPSDVGNPAESAPPPKTPSQAARPKLEPPAPKTVVAKLAAAAKNKTEPKSVEKVPAAPKSAETAESKPSAKVPAKPSPAAAAYAENAKKIAEALQMYANVFDGAFPKPDGPAGLDVLRKKGFIEDPNVFAHPGTKRPPLKKDDPLTEENCDYIYRGGLTEKAPPDTPVLWSKPENHKDFGVVLYANGDVKTLVGEDWTKRVESLGKR